MEQVKTFFNYTLILNIFLGGVVLFTSPFEFYFGYIFILAFLSLYILRYGKIYYNPTFLAILSILTLSSLVSVFAGENTIFYMMKPLSGIFITGIAYYLLIKVNDYKIDKLFRIYLQIALLVAMIGVFQEASYLMGFKEGYHYGWIIPKWSFAPAAADAMIRVNSVFMEPSHFAISMAPALFVALSNIFRKNSPYSSTMFGRAGSLIIIVSYMLTFSAVAYVAIVISLLLIFDIRKLRNLAAVLAITAALVCGAYFFSSEMHTRIVSMVGIFTGSKSLFHSHLSFYTLFSNAFVSYKSFIDNPLFGHGLGSHPVSFDEHIRTFQFFIPEYPVANRMDAGSLIARLISETGLFGTITVLYFVFKFRLKAFENNNLSIMSNAIFILFMAQLMKQGHYFYNGLFFFVWVYYFVYRSIQLTPKLSSMPLENRS